jgi:hypothetical protein
MTAPTSVRVQHRPTILEGNGSGHHREVPSTAFTWEVSA